MVTRNEVQPFIDQFLPYVKNSQLICFANALTCFYRREHWSLMAYIRLLALHHDSY